MSNSVSLSTFPANRAQAVAYAWLQQQDLSKKTPAEAAELYQKALQEVIGKNKEYTADARAKFFNS